MKKIISFFIVSIIVSVFSAGLCGCSNNAKVAGDTATLYVYNWGEYLSDGSEGSLDVNKAFEEYCRDTLGKNVSVNYSTYASNEDLYSKLSSGAVTYDVIFPSDYMIARLANEGLLAEINPENNIENYKYISDDFKNLYYDPENKYSVPYTYGTVGIIYNTEMVPENEENIGSWKLMWDEDYNGNILQFNNPRDAFGTAQYMSGYSVNSTNENEWQNCIQLLKNQKKIVQGYVMDEIFNKMAGGSAAISAYYAGDYFTMYSDNDLLSFYYPEEGTNIFVDAMCVPANTQNYELAIEYINFMLSEEPAIENAEYICYASPNTLVYENEDYITYMQEEVHPDALSILYDFDSSKMEFYYDLPDNTRDLMNSLWEDLKIESSIGTSIYVICAIIVVSLIVLLISKIVINQRRKYYYNKYSK